MRKEVSFKNRDRFIQLGIAISSLRKVRGMSQEKLAEKAGISRSLLSVIEAPNTANSFTIAVNVVDVLLNGFQAFFNFLDTTSSAVIAFSYCFGFLGKFIVVKKIMLRQEVQSVRHSLDVLNSCPLSVCFGIFLTLLHSIFNINDKRNSL